MKQALCKDARMQDCKVFNSEQTDTLVRPKSGFTPTKPEVSCVPMLASVTLRDAERVRPNKNARKTGVSCWFSQESALTSLT